ncbi:class I SAM-dependent methyltransferase [Vibrio sp. 03-59-1]|nr:hypothetical protein [Vibrio sp. 03-59-1]NOH84528.1 class I SAM-dependent methyltransferase [Vibrio sp. 03-59-1]
MNEEETEILFDVISMWEVFEHIQENDCSLILSNIKKNFSDKGIFVGSISTLEYVNSETGVPYHVTIKDEEWWRELFYDNGLEFVESEFDFHEYCRGVGSRFQDPHSYRKYPSAGFHFVAKKSMTSS